MELELILTMQIEVDCLVQLVLNQIRDYGLNIKPLGAVRSKTRPLDVGAFEFTQNDEFYGRFEYELKGEQYTIKFQTEMPQLYDQTLDTIAKIYPEKVKQYQ